MYCDTHEVRTHNLDLDLAICVHENIKWNGHLCNHLSALGARFAQHTNNYRNTEISKTKFYLQEKAHFVDSVHSTPISTYKNYHHTILINYYSTGEMSKTTRTHTILRYEHRQTKFNWIALDKLVRVFPFCASIGVVKKKKKECCIVVSQMKNETITETDKLTKSIHHTFTKAILESLRLLVSSSYF